MGVAVACPWKGGLVWFDWLGYELYLSVISGRERSSLCERARGLLFNYTIRVCTLFFFFFAAAN